jgi:hypothetical protein
MYKSYFSLKDAQKRFNINKIKYNVFDYSLKNKIIYEDLLTFNPRNDIASKEYGAEDYLLNIINTKHTFSTQPIFSFNGITFPQSHYLYHTSPDRKKLSGFSHTFLLNNDLYINLENLVWFFRVEDIFKEATDKEHAGITQCLSLGALRSTLEYLDKSKVLDALIQLVCALTRKDSLIPNLGWLMTEYNTEKLTVVNELEMIKNNFKKSQIFKTSFDEGITCNWMPIQNALSISHKKHSKGFMGGILDYEHLLTVGSSLDKALMMQFKKVLVYTIEILNAIETIDSSYASKLHELLVHNLGDDNTFIKTHLYSKDMYGNIVINTKVKEIIEIKDMSERYEAIQDYVNKVTTFPDITLFQNNKEYVPVFLASFVQFCNDYSFRSIRIKIILYLLELLKELGLSLRKTVKDTDEIDDFLGDIGNLGINMEEVLNNDLINFHFEEYSEKTTPENNMERSAKVAKRAASNDILDKATAGFSENGYKFDIKTITNTTVTESAKTKYNTIVSKVNLVCKNLTKQIRDIKTYNEGGKNPGQISGKLDKKAIYRYKYDKNIFYNNTYKIKESDLAFGILLDVSGSMSGEGIENGKATMIILHEVLKTLGINHCIATHNSYGEHQCNIRKFVQFKENANYVVNKCFELANISANSGNCDSGALYFMEQELMRTTNKDKICLIFSDGEPTECSDAELRDQVKHMERLGIKVIGIGINFENIKDYYNDYANGRTLKEMLDIVSNILKQYVLDKKD